VIVLNLLYALVIGYLTFKCS